jgi:transposase
VDLSGPTWPDYGWQAVASRGFTAVDIAIDWERRGATCPQGRTSSGWTPVVDQGHTEVIYIKCSKADCKTCQASRRWTRTKSRSLTVRSRERFEALDLLRGVSLLGHDLAPPVESAAILASLTDSFTGACHSEGGIYPLLEAIPDGSRT